MCKIVRDITTGMTLNKSSSPTLQSTISPSVSTSNGCANPSTTLTTDHYVTFIQDHKAHDIRLHLLGGSKHFSTRIQLDPKTHHCELQLLKLPFSQHLQERSRLRFLRASSWLVALLASGSRLVSVEAKMDLQTAESQTNQPGFPSFG